MTARHTFIRLGGLMAVAMALAGAARADFTLTGSDHLDVTSLHTKGELYDASSADVCPGGEVLDLQNYDASCVDITGGTVEYLHTYNSSSTALSAGEVRYLLALDTSSVNIFGGSISGWLSAWDGTRVSMSGGSMAGPLNACHNSRVNISGGNVSVLEISDNSSVTMTRGIINNLTAYYVGAFGGERVNVSGGSVGVLTVTLRVDGEQQVAFADAPWPAVLAPHGVFVSGGTVGSLHFGLSAYDNARIAVTGGSILDTLEGLFAYDNSNVAVSGGSVRRLAVTACAFGEERVNISGGTVKRLDVSLLTQGSQELILCNEAWPAMLAKHGILVSEGTVGKFTLSVSAHNSSRVAVTGGTIGAGLYAYDGSRVDVSGGSLPYLLSAANSSVVTISGGILENLYAYESCGARISGGSINNLYAWGGCVDIFGGETNSLDAYEGAAVRFYGYDLLATQGLILDGEEVLGTGLLTGKWFDGTSWVLTIRDNQPGARIYAFSEPYPEPATLSLLALGGLVALRRRR